MVPHSRPWIRQHDVEAVTAVLNSSHLIGGSEVGKFKEKLADICGNDRVALFSSGRQAVCSALKALQLPPGAGVIVQTYVCDAVTSAIRAAGLEPILCDIGDGWVCTAENVSDVATTDCAAIVLAPPFGFLQSAAPFRRFGLPIIHDLCQASPGLLCKFQRESFGDIVTLSFHPTKYICAGGGGATVAMTAHYHAALTEQEVASSQYAPMTDIQAAMGSAQLSDIEIFEELRSRLFQDYFAHAPGSATARLMQNIDVPPGAMFRLPLDVQSNARGVLDRFAAEQVIARHGVDQLAHRSVARPDYRFPNSIRAFGSTVSCPFHPSLDQRERSQIMRAIGIVLCP